MPSASFLQAFPAAHGELQSSRGGQSLSLTSSPSGGAPGLRTGVSAEFAARWDPWSWFVRAVRSPYPPPSKSRWPCLPLGCGSWKLWPDCFFVLQPHTRPYFSQSPDSRAEPVTRRRPGRLRSPGGGDLAGGGCSTPRSLLFSGFAQQTPKADWSPTSPQSPPGAAGASQRPE